MSLSSRWGGRLVLVASVIVFAQALTALPASASTSTETFVSMVSESGDYIGQGQNRFFHPGNGEIAVAGNPGSLNVGVSGGNLGDAYTLQFAAPPGQTLQVGEYERAQRTHSREAGRPGMDISGDGRGCNDITGRFKVNEITTTPEGGIASLWIVYEQHCEGGPKALIGEVRYGVAGDGGNVMLSPRSVRWPKADVDSSMKVVPVTVVNPGPESVTMGTSSISGSTDFNIVLDGCSGATLAQNGSCQVLVRYRPSASGDRAGTLTVPESSGPSHTVSLEGFAYGGTTRIELSSEPGDWVGAGQNYSYTPGNSTISAQGGHERVSGSVTTSTGDTWRFTFDAPDGDILAPGSTYEAANYPFNGTGAGLDFSGHGRGCNQVVGTFTITGLTVNGSGELERFGVHFEQHCDGNASSPALYGLIDFRMDPATDPGPYALAVTKVGGGTVTSNVSGISCGDDCAEEYDFGSVVTLTASPEPGQTFSGWSGACAGTGPCSVKMVTIRDVTANFSLQKLGSSLDVSLSRSRVDYKNSLRVSVHLGAFETADNQTVSIFKTPAGGTKQLVKTGSVNSNGNISVRVDGLTRKTVFTAQWNGDDLYESTSTTKTVLVRAAIRNRLSGAYATRNGYKLFHDRVNPLQVATVTPNNSGYQVKFTAQARVGRSWKTVASRTFDLVGSRSSAVFLGSARGATYRVRATFTGSPNNLAATAPWRYLKITA